MKKGWTADNAAQTLVFAGGAVILSTGLLAIFGMPLSFTFMFGHMMVYPSYNMGFYIGAIETASGFMILISVLLMARRSNVEHKYWYTLAMIFAVIGLIGGGGLLVGSLLAVIGSVLGISYKPNPVQNVRATRSPGARSVQYHADEKAQTRIMAGLNAEEKSLYKMVVDSGGAAFQADLVEKSGFSKVKVSRVLDRLEGRGLIERRRRGMTNMVVMKNSAPPAT